MICALTVRKLKPGTFDQFREAFMSGVDDGEGTPEGLVSFNMVRNAHNPDEVICFGFFDSDVEGVRATAAEAGYAEQQAAIAPFVESVGTDGLFEVVENVTA